MAIADKPTELSEQVLDSLNRGGQAALEALKKFVDTVDQALPRLGAAPSWRQQVIDSGLEMAERLIQAQYDFLRNVVSSAGTSLGASPPRGEVETPNPGQESRSPVSGSKRVAGRSARPSRTARPGRSSVGASASSTP
jgi:hypothetical protein